MEIENLTSDIYTHIRREMNHSNDFDMATNILQEGIVDSISILSLVAFLEERYGIEISFEDITAENFANVGSIAKFMKTLIK